ncbi:hypothetical protein [Parendozoicomonas haliclonae]|nr:hypothetical protein [Parendozoicomonas haliclonae]
MQLKQRKIALHVQLVQVKHQRMQALQQLNEARSWLQTLVQHQATLVQQQEQLLAIQLDLQSPGAVVDPARVQFTAEAVLETNKRQDQVQHDRLSAKKKLSSIYDAFHTYNRQKEGLESALNRLAQAQEQWRSARQQHQTDELVLQRRFPNG